MIVSAHAEGVRVRVIVPALAGLAFVSYGARDAGAPPARPPGLSATAVATPTSVVP